MVDVVELDHLHSSGAAAPLLFLLMNIYSTKRNDAAPEPGSGDRGKVEATMTVHADRAPAVIEEDQPAVDRLRALATNAKVVRVIHADLFGRQRAKQYPAAVWEELLDGVALSKVSLAEDLFGVPVSAAEFPELAGHPDLSVRPDPETVLVPPWEPDSVWVLGRLFEHGRPSALCARGALRDAQERLVAGSGLAAITACEPEFYLFQRTADGSRGAAYARDGVSYTIDRPNDPTGAVGRLHRRLIDFGIGVTAVNREFSPGQFEINLRHTDAGRAADQVFLLKSAVKELAVDEGLVANFMGKPVTGEEGSSLHIHMSLWDGDQNAFATPGGGLSDRALAAVAGIQHHAAALLAFASPTVNSYRRLVGEGLSPRRSNWGEDNRLSFVRVPAERGSATRLELRAGDASASPHLLTAALLHAVRDGVERDLRPSDDGVLLPRSLDESLAALQRDDVFTEAFGAEFVKVYVALKTAEIDRLAATVTDAEWQLYSHHA
ncbi:glutamine synthetase family protein [Pseudonocardia sp. CA-107938]|uniref:glutamine synthetase family protein n=1 Tax=Pseudonocardia sp. CA-107938 TaxID=3240021 RepID=UPI003D9008BF